MDLRTSYHNEMDSGTIMIAVFVVITLTAYIYRKLYMKWKEKAAAAFFVVGQRAKTREEREWGYRSSLMAGNRKAEKFYFYAAIDKFEVKHPLTPFAFDCGSQGKVPCVFYDYYIPKREKDCISWEQRQFQSTVYKFKDGEESCSKHFKEAIACLNLTEETTVIFMPCSSKSKYMARFAKLSKALSYVDGLKPYLYSQTYLEERECKHKSKERNDIKADSNVAVCADIVGKNVVLVDDVMTTGKSLCEYAEELYCYGVRVVGIVCLAKSVQYPHSSKRIYRKARQEASHFIIS